MTAEDVQESPASGSPSPEEGAGAQPAPVLDDRGNPEELELEPGEPQTDAERQRETYELRNMRAASTGSGDAVGGDKIVNRILGGVHLRTDGSVPWRTRVYTDEEHAAFRARFARTPTADTLGRLLRNNPVAVLKGPPGSGRTAAAFAALDRHADRLCVLHGERVPAELGADLLRKGDGYVYDASDTRWARQPDETALLGCREVLEEQGARLVVILPSDADTAVLRQYVVDHHPPNTRQVLENHLLADLPRSQVETILRGLDGNESRSPQEAVDLAEDLGHGLRAGRTIREVLDERPDPCRQHARELLQKKDGTVNPTGRRAMVVAAAVLEGLPLVVVTRAAQRLAGTLHRVESYNKGPDKGLGQPTFGENVAAWLDHLGAQDPGPDRTLRLGRHGLAKEILHVVWNEYVVAHQPFLDWLEALAGDRNTKVRLKAALAVGQLAGYDFDVIERTYFVRWSNDKQMALHRVTAWALEEAVKQVPENFDRILDLARQWSQAGIARQSTAAQLYGTLLGVATPNAAMRGLRRIAGGRYADQLYETVANSVTEIFAGGAPVPVVAELVDWARSPHLPVRASAARALARIGRVESETRPGWPLLLALFPNEPEPVVELWWRMLTGRANLRDPWRVLREWSQLAIRRRDLADVFRALVARLAIDPFLRSRIEFYLRPRMGPSDSRTQGRQK